MTTKQNTNSSAVSDRRIEVDVGGMKFTTSLATITKFPESQLASYFNSKGGPQSDKFFIDRDGTHFRYILNYLRDNEVDIPNDGQIQKEIRKEAIFYGLSGLVAAIEGQSTPQTKPKKYHISAISPSQSFASQATEEFPASPSNGQTQSILIDEVLKEIFSIKAKGSHEVDEQSLDKLLKRTKDDLDSVMKMLDYSHKLRDALENDAKDLKNSLEEQGPTPNLAKLEQEVVELRMELDRYRKSERKALGQKAKLKEEMKHMEEEIEILKGVIYKEKIKMTEEVAELNERMEEEIRSFERQKKHLELELLDLKEQIEERDQIIEKQKQLFEQQLNDLKNQLTNARRSE